MLAKLFKAYDVRATYPDPLNESAVWRIGVAVGRFLRQGNDGRLGEVVVTRDMRPSSPSLCTALIHGIRSSGMGVIDLGMCDTSMQYFAIPHLGAVGGVQVTASHNPVHYNGLKISGPGARPIGATSGLRDIQAIAESVTDVPADPLGHGGVQPDRQVSAGDCRSIDLWPAYRRHVLSFYKPSPTGRKLRVFIDASNGMGGKLVPKVFADLPGEGLEILPLHFEITGRFVHEPNPLVAENMRPTQEGVRRHGADLGVCFDGDADRCILTDEQGTILGCDHLTALLAEYFLDPATGGTAGASVIYDLRSSKAVEETVRRLGGTPVRSRVGHVFMKALLRETGGVFGGELSGHFYFRDNHCADSGAIAFASVLSLLSRSGRKMSELIAPYQRYPQSGEINFVTADKDAVMKKLQSDFAAGAVIDTLDGVTIDAWGSATCGGLPGGWWANVRASNTEPLLRLNAEARDRAVLDHLLARIKPLLGTEHHGH